MSAERSCWIVNQPDFRVRDTITNTLYLIADLAFDTERPPPSELYKESASSYPYLQLLVLRLPRESKGSINDLFTHCLVLGLLSHEL